jgi:hypothetical protein
MATSTCLAPPGPGARATGRAGTRQNVLIASRDAVYARAHSGYFRGRAIAWCSEISVDRADVCCCAIPCQVGCGIFECLQ